MNTRQKDYDSSALPLSYPAADMEMGNELLFICSNGAAYKVRPVAVSSAKQTMTCKIPCRPAAFHKAGQAAAGARRLFRLASAAGSRSERAMNPPPNTRAFSPAAE